MKTRELMRLVRQYVVPSLEGFRIHRSLLYVHPVEMVLRGFDWQCSYMDPCAFTVEVFAQPLYVPSDCVVYTFGNRLSWLKHRRDLWWRLDCEGRSSYEAIFEEIVGHIFDVGLPFLRRLWTPEDFVRHGASASGVPRDPHVCEVIAYSRVLIGDYGKAARELKRLHDELVREQEVYPWMREVAERAAYLLKLLHQSPDGAVRQLHAWRDWTLKQLRLEKEIEAQP